MKRYFFIVCLILVYNVISAQKQTYHIGFLLDYTNPEIESLLDRLELEIERVVGEDARIEYPGANRLVNNFNNERAIANYESYINSNVDIIIAFGIINSAVLSKFDTYSKPTILFGTISKELLGENFKFNKKQNLTTIVTLQSYEEDLIFLKEIANPKKVAVILENNFADNIPGEKLFSALGSKLDMDLRLLKFEKLEDILSALDGLDAVYLIGGFYLSTEEIKVLAQELINRDLASFTTTPTKDVENGLLASAHDASEVEQYFRRIALTVESIVNEDILQQSTILEANRNVSINFNTAEQIGISLKYSLIANTNLVGNSNKRYPDKTYSLIEVMKEAIEENLLLESTRQSVELSDQDVRFAKSDYLPNLSVTARGNIVDAELAEAARGRNPQFSTDGTVGLSQLVYSPEVSANITIQQALRNAQKENYRSDELNTVFDAANAYFSALILKANLSIQNQNLELTKYNLKIATENYEAGQAGKSDVLRFKSESVQNTQDLIEAVNQLDQSFYVLNQVLNNPIDNKIDVEDAVIKEGVFSNYNYKRLGEFLDDPQLRKPFVKFLVAEAINNAPELKALDYNIQAAQRSAALFGAGRFIPDVAVQGQYFYQFSRSGEGSSFPPLFPTIPQGYYNVGLNVTIPVFNQNKQNINEQIAQIQLEQLSTNRSNIQLSIEKNVNDAVLEIVNQITNIELSRVFEETAKEALELTQASYANGAVNIVQLLDAQNNFLQAQLASLNANYTYLQSAIRLERFIGTFFLLQTDEEREEFLQRFLEFSNTTQD